MAADDTESLERYKCQPLDLQTDSFRLLRLHPGQGLDPIKCSLSVESLAEQKTKYIALSYTWGEPKTCQWIEIDGCKHEARQNLFDFLSTFRHESEPQVLWIDAVCIDQSSIKERNHQVSLMGNIYRGASEVVVWLGLASAKSKMFFKPLTTIRLPREVMFDLEELSTKLKWIFEQTYFTRIWIVQELLLARSIKVMVGQDFLGWDRLNSLWRLASGPGHHKFSIEFLRSLVYVREEINEKREMNLPNLIRKFSHLKCQVPHDHVYALLGLVENLMDVQVDYAISLEGLLVQTACNTFTSKDFVQLLADALSVDISETQHHAPNEEEYVTLTLQRLGTLNLPVLDGSLYTLFENLENVHVYEVEDGLKRNEDDVRDIILTPNAGIQQGTAVYSLHAFAFINQARELGPMSGDTVFMCSETSDTLTCYSGLLTSRETSFKASSWGTLHHTGAFMSRARAIERCLRRSEQKVIEPGKSVHLTLRVCDLLKLIKHWQERPEKVVFPDH